MLSEGQVEEILGRVEGAQRKKKTYWITPDGHDLWPKIMELAESLGEQVQKAAKQSLEPTPTGDEVEEDSVVQTAEPGVNGVDQFMKSVNEIYGPDEKFRTGTANREVMLIGHIFLLVRLQAQMAA